jgi:hypothetical protein
MKILYGPLKDELEASKNSMLQRELPSVYESHHDTESDRRSETIVLAHTAEIERREIAYAKASTPVEDVVGKIRGGSQTFIERNLRNSPIRVAWYKRLRTFERLATYPIIALSVPILASIIVRVVEAAAPSMLSSILGQGLAWLVPAFLTLPVWIPLALVGISLLALISSTISNSNAFSQAERATAFPRMKHYYRKPGQTSTLKEGR